MIDKTTDPDFIQEQINKHNPQPNATLDDVELFELQAKVRSDLKTFSFTLFGRVFKFETYTEVKKRIRRITECDEIMCSDETIMNGILKDRLTKEQKEELSSMFDGCTGEILENNIVKIHTRKDGYGK